MNEYNGICNKCKKEFTLKRYGINNRNRNNQEFDLCTTCLLSNIRKQSYGNMTDEQKKSRGDKISMTRINKSIEEKELIKNKTINSWNVNREKNIENIINGHLNMSEDAKRAAYLKIAESKKKWWESLMEEDLALIKNNASKRELERLSSMTKSERLYYKLLIGNRHRDRIAKMNDIERNEFFYNMAIGIAMSRKINGPTEKDFANDLLTYSIPYEWGYVNQIIHDNFNKLFPINPITNQRVSPYHAWDFKVGNILIDIDGSIHMIDCIVTHKSGTVTSIKSLIQFNDSQRPYQTDGLDWYIIQCYDDKLTDDTNVLVGKSNEIIKYKDLLNILKCDSTIKKEG